MDVKGYYKTLGVNENASQEEIKKAYRALCMKWHPDRWATATEEEKKKAEDEFKKVAEAYDTLGDEEKKRQYDSGFGGGEDDGDFDPFAEMFKRWASQGGGFPGFNGFGGQQQRPSGHPGEDVHAYVTITFAESLTMNLMKDVTVKKKVECPDCKGTGSEDGQKHECPYCHGTGMETHTQRYGNSFTMTQSPCSHCHGTGKQIDHPCKKCGGSGFVEKEETMKLSIPGGLRDGMSILYSGMGGAGSHGWQNGDLILHVTVKQDVPGYFQTQDNDANIYHTEKVNFVDALLGSKVTVKCPNGKDWTINLRECTQPGERFTKSNGGYPMNRRTGSDGDYVVFIEYDVPSRLTKAQRKALEEYKNEK
jgi:molecular chaperone DnaJ